MKAFNNIFIAAITVVAMTACNNELSEQLASNKGGDVKFTMGIEGTSASRVAMEDGSYQASFENTNAVGIFVKEVSSYSNLEYTLNGSTWSGATISVPAEDVYTYYAYYPYVESATSTAITTEVSVDQETGGYLANDFLMSSLTAEAGQSDVNLQFTHALSLVEVTLSGPNAAEDAVVTLSNMTTDATVNLEASTVTPGDKKANVIMDKLTTSMKYRAIVPEQTVAQGTALMTIVSKGRTYKVSYKASDVKFKKGKYISLNVELGSSSSAEDVTVTITSQGITNWEAGTGVEGDASVSVAELNIPLPTDGNVLETISSNWSATTSANQIGADKPEGWYKRSGTTGTTVTVPIVSPTEIGYDKDEQALTIKRSSDSNGQWNSDNVMYHSCAPLEIGQYELSFDLKGASVDGNTVYGTVGFGISTSGDDYLFRIPIISNDDYGRTLTTKAATSDYVTVTTKFNFDEISTQTKSSGLLQGDFTEATADNVNKGVNIIFYSNKVTITNPSILYIRNIKLTKVEE